MGLLDRPNHVPEHQRYFQQPSKYPLFLRGPRDKLYVCGAFLMIGTGLVGSLWGAVRMARGAKD